MLPDGDPMGTQRLKKVPMGTRVPKWGPIWEQCNTLPLDPYPGTLNIIITVGLGQRFCQIYQEA